MPVAVLAGDKRVAADGVAYTKSEFESYFGSAAEWNTAPAAAAWRGATAPAAEPKPLF